MTSEPNPDPSPGATLPHGDEYALTPFRPVLRSSADVLLEAVEERAGQGWRLVTSFCIGGGTRYLVWTRNACRASAGEESGPYRILPVPTFKERLRQRSSGPWQRAFAERLAHLETGWAVAAFCPFVGCVLRYSAALAGTPIGREDYSTLRRTPVWWRTLFGYSWIQLLSDELNRRPQPEAEIISYLGGDHFLTATNRGPGRAELNDGPGASSCRLMMWPNWKRLLRPGPPNIAPWFVEQAMQGWTLLSQYEGAIFLFATPAKGIEL